MSGLQQAKEWAVEKLESILNSPAGKALEAHGKALEVYTRDHTPLDWAMTQGNLDMALYRFGQRQKSVERLEQAVEAYNNALKAYTFKHTPPDWAKTQNGLGNVFNQLGDFERKAEWLNRAKGAFEGALTVYTLEDIPESYKRATNNLDRTQSLLKELGGK